MRWGKGKWREGGEEDWLGDYYVPNTWCTGTTTCSRTPYEMFECCTDWTMEVWTAPIVGIAVCAGLEVGGLHTFEFCRCNSRIVAALFVVLWCWSRNASETRWRPPHSNNEVNKPQVSRSEWAGRGRGDTNHYKYHHCSELFQSPIRPIMSMGHQCKSRYG